jgi:hypothetical protein
VLLRAAIIAVMSVVSRSMAFEAVPADAEALWYDTERWGSWIDGFGTLLERRGAWPEVGGSLVWESTPAGRGRVTERVRDYEPGVGQTVSFDDDRLSGSQRVDFVAAEGGVEVTLTLDYGLIQGGWSNPIVDVLFIRRALRDSLDRTLSAFGRELASPDAPRR